MTVAQATSELNILPSQEKAAQSIIAADVIIIAKKYIEANPPLATGQHHKQWSSRGQQLFVQYPDYPQLHSAA